MIFWAAVEGYQPAYEGITRTRKSVESFLNKELAKSSLAEIPAELRYVPIIMPRGMRERYPARSKLRKRERVYLSAPQLNYEVFVSGSFEDQLKEYIRGIALSAPHLKGLGATAEQIEEFKRILAEAVPRILVEQPDQTRH